MNCAGCDKPLDYDHLGVSVCESCRVVAPRAQVPWPSRHLAGTSNWCAAMAEELNK